MCEGSVGPGRATFKVKDSSSTETISLCSGRHETVVSLELSAVAALHSSAKQNTTTDTPMPESVNTWSEHEENGH